MITTHYYAGCRNARSDSTRRERPHRLATPRLRARSSRPAPAEAHDQTQVTFVFQGGRTLSPVELATLRVFAAAGVRPTCVIAGSSRAPDAASYHAALRSCSERRSAGVPHDDA